MGARLAAGMGACPEGPEPWSHFSCRKPPVAVKKEEEKKPHIKKPLNAFMLYMKEMRAKVVAECTLKESAAINQILGRRVWWRSPHQGPFRRPGFTSPRGSDLGHCQPRESQGGGGDLGGTWMGRDAALQPRAAGPQGQQCGFGDSSCFWGFQCVALIQHGSGCPSMCSVFLVCI